LPSTRSSAPSPDPERRRRVGAGTLVLIGILVLAVVAVFATIRADDGNDGGSDASTPRPADASTAGVAVRGDPAPAFDLAALRGPGRVSRSRFAGRPLIVNFWASYCQPCRKEFPLFAAAQKKYAPDGLAIVGITYRDLAGDARSFARQHHATWPLADGGEGDPAARAYGVRAIPQTFFVDRRGTIVSRFYGAPSGDRFDAEVRRIIDS
jgi:cytochrome c biogenesis protein CcmG, thiol:disulfide interchange protein DsbE